MCQLTKPYSSGAKSWTRAFTKPVAETVTIALNGTPQPSGWAVSNATGLITVTTAPAAGVAISAGLESTCPAASTPTPKTVQMDALAANLSLALTQSAQGGAAIWWGMPTYPDLMLRVPLELMAEVTRPHLGLIASK